jgi:DMSO/TMAO reductase YedYZ molybdopterin-dependent catalytic subunit
MLGADIVFGGNLPRNYIPVAFQDQDPGKLFGKNPQMIVLNDLPWNIETPAHLLDDKVTPSDKMFIRNNGIIPENLDKNNWTLKVDGESVREQRTFSLDELKKKFKPYTYDLTLECGGNGRKEYYPTTEGNQWDVGAVSCAQWTGIRLRDLLKEMKILDNAVYVGYHGADSHLSRDPNKESISRGVPIHKAMEDETLLAFQMNGADIPTAHGFPLRLIASGYPASVSGKWLKGLSIRDKVHDGAKMESPSYRIPCEPIAPGEEVKPEDMCIIESMPVKSLITYPKTGAIISGRNTLSIRGHAWAGNLEVKQMAYSIDFGVSWQSCRLTSPVNKFAWQHFEAEVSFPSKGYYEIWARATDSKGKTQPMLSPGWNPKGYINNACHRIAVKVS